MFKDDCTICVSIYNSLYIIILACQCNGHSKCLSNSSICIQPCGNLTYGPHCDKCIPGYYGNPLNGATCQRKFILSYVI